RSPAILFHRTAVRRRTRRQPAADPPGRGALRRERNPGGVSKARLAASLHFRNRKLWPAYRAAPDDADLVESDLINRLQGGWIVAGDNGEQARALAQLPFSREPQQCPVKSTATEFFHGV